MTSHDWTLIFLALGAVGVLVVLVARFKSNAFIGLLVAALLLGSGTDLGMTKVLKSFQDGLGATLGGIAGVIALGVMLGRLLAESGGAEVLARRFNRFFGSERAVWCIMALALAIGLTTWFAVGLVLLLPVLITLARESGRPFWVLALPLISCLGVMHGLMPPHPGPVIAIEALKANTGLVLVWGVIIGLPTAAVAGPLFARWAMDHDIAQPPSITASAAPVPPKAPRFDLTLFTMLLPVALMLLGTAAELLLPKTDGARSTLEFIGNPTIAMLISVIFALWSLGLRAGHDSSSLLRFTEESVAGIGMTLLIVGGGGGFARVLRDAGVAESLGRLACLLHMPPLLYAWLVAAFIRVATGSATVAITAASGVLAPLVVETPGINRELLVISMGCGSLFFSHLNDGGFWIVKECFGLSVGQTLRTWTVTATLIGVAGLLFTLAADLLWRMIHG
ncbi:MAG: gluconate transporter [Chthoniobacteraceae bacterium]|nr:gluconate transporter [Chthoniobacteraceae bacterium]